MNIKQKTLAIALFAVASTTAASLLFQPAVDSTLTSGNIKTLTEK